MVSGAPDAEAVGLHKDHTGLAKFSQEDDGDFELLSRQLSQMAKLAPTKNACRWEDYRRREGRFMRTISFISLLTTRAYRCQAGVRNHIPAIASLERNIHRTRTIS